MKKNLCIKLFLQSSFPIWEELHQFFVELSFFLCWKKQSEKSKKYSNFYLQVHLERILNLSEEKISRIFLKAFDRKFIFELSTFEKWEAIVI